MSSSLLTQSTTWLTRAEHQWWKTHPEGKHIWGCWEDSKAGSADLWLDLRNCPGRCVWGNAREGWSLLALAVPTGFCSDLCYGSCWSISNLSVAVVTQSSLPRLVAGSCACVPRDTCLHLWEQSAEEASSLPNREGGACATVVDCGLCPEKCIRKGEGPWLFWFFILLQALHSLPEWPLFTFLFFTLIASH